MIDKIDRYAVFGNPIAHSKSPQIHTLFAEQTNQSLTYTAELAEINQFETAVKIFIKNGGKGLNITVPFKQDAWACAAQRSERAQRAGAVNTLILQADNTLFGDTTDGVGLVRDLMQNHNIQIKNKTILLIGAGGAVRGVLEALLEQQPSSLLIANRTKQKAVQLAADFSDLGKINGCGLDEINNARFDIVINGTSASLKGDLPPIPKTVFNENSCSYDMMYAVQATPFMQWSKSNGGKQIFDGLGMLVEQAAESFYLWRKVKPETAPVIKLLRASFNS
ncbi:Shikimate 5-dehydrogenase I alpha [hydrothermal vent metagenome]|uniref:shikimate dehydrogenase (NADP(+)) n=1 Tax=hydrothermal vent metagenome TaxID=652676 RepID=A0A3B0WJW1_9ZZZZ